jgi:hypothetical protein
MLLIVKRRQQGAAMQNKTRVTRRVGDRIEVGYTTPADFGVYVDLTGGSARYAYPSREAAASDGWEPSEFRTA